MTKLFYTNIGQILLQTIKLNHPNTCNCLSPGKGKSYLYSNVLSNYFHHTIVDISIGYSNIMFTNFQPVQLIHECGLLRTRLYFLTSCVNCLQFPDFLESFAAFSDSKFRGFVVLFVACFDFFSRRKRQISSVMALWCVGAPQHFPDLQFILPHTKGEYCEVHCESCRGASICTVRKFI